MPTITEPRYITLPHSVEEDIKKLYKDLSDTADKLSEHFPEEAKLIMWNVHEILWLLGDENDIP